jgi:hypothetical protein
MDSDDRPRTGQCGQVKVGSTGMQWVCTRPTHDFLTSDPDELFPLKDDVPEWDKHYFQPAYPYRASTA